MKVIDLSNWSPDITFDDGVVLCRKLKLVETMQHGEHDYVRLTQRGINVLCTLMEMAQNAANPNNVLTPS